MLNTFPGYREIDLAAFFMIAMPVFAAMLTGDGGYGLVFMLPGVLFYKKLVNKMGREGVQLLIIFGAAAFIWGVLTANFFGVTPETMAKAGGFFVLGNEHLTYQNLRDGDGGWAFVGNLMMDAAPLWRESGESSRELLIKISFLVGSLQLVVAHLRRSISLLPGTRSIANIGWAIVLVAMLGLIWSMFFEDDEISVSSSLIMTLLGAGMILVVIFGSPDPNPLKRVGVGIASSLLPLIATFSDTMSYIRLMAVSLASFYIAKAFNTLGGTVADSATWGAGTLVVLFGHTLNMALVVIAIFAHGVRLNMLEFSNNAGVEWAGYAYNPFSKLKA
jgi:V/A-type H+-transporting ATPase subunit I